MCLSTKESQWSMEVRSEESVASMLADVAHLFAVACVPGFSLWEPAYGPKGVAPAQQVLGEA